MKITLDLDQLLREQRITPEEAEHLRGLAGPRAPQRQVRGLGAVAVWAVLGLLLGGLFGTTILSPGVLGRLAGGDSAGLVHGSLTGLLVGAAGGIFVWVFHPYRGEP